MNPLVREDSTSPEAEATSPSPHLYNRSTYASPYANQTGMLIFIHTFELALRFSLKTSKWRIYEV